MIWLTGWMMFQDHCLQSWNISRYIRKYYSPTHSICCFLFLLSIAFWQLKTARYIRYNVFSNLREGCFPLPQDRTISSLHCLQLVLDSSVIPEGSTDPYMKKGSSMRKTGDNHVSCLSSTKINFIKGSTEGIHFMETHPSITFYKEKEHKRTAMLSLWECY